MTKNALKTTNAPAAIGPYSQAVLVNDTLYASGQIGLVPETGAFAGDSTLAQVAQIFKNITGVLSAADMSVANIVKVSIFLTDMADFEAVNDAYAAFFADVDILPARSAVAVAALPKRARVEIEITAVR